MANVFAPVQQFFAQPSPLPRLPQAEVQRLYPRYRWGALESTFLGYATYYLARNNVSTVAKEIQGALGYTHEMVGNILAITAISYGLSKFLIGSLSDHSDARKFMATGLVLTALCNFAFGAATNYYVHLFLWGLNGFVQGMGWPPCGRVMGHWFSEKERGLTFSIWNTSHNVGGGISGFLAAWAVTHFGAWQYTFFVPGQTGVGGPLDAGASWAATFTAGVASQHRAWQNAFYVPGVIALIGAVYLFLRMRDTPQSVGLPPIEEFRNDYPAAGESIEDLERELTFKELFIDKVLLNKYVWLLSIANFFAYITRYSMIDWGPTYLREVKGASLMDGGYATMVIEFGGIPSTILFGWLSDKVGGRRGMVAALCMMPIILAFGVMVMAPSEAYWLSMAMLFTIGFFVYPVINLITIAALDTVSKKAIGTAAGFIGMWGYIGRTVQASVFGRIVDQYSKTIGYQAAWDIVLWVIVGCAVVATVLLALTWNSRPKA